MAFKAMDKWIDWDVVERVWLLQIMVEIDVLADPDRANVCMDMVDEALEPFLCAQGVENPGTNYITAEEVEAILQGIGDDRGDEIELGPVPAWVSRVSCSTPTCRQGWTRHQRFAGPPLRAAFAVHG